MPNRRLLIRSLKYALSLGRPGPDLSWITDLVGVSGTLLPHHIPALARTGVRSIIDLREEDMDDPDLMAEHGIRLLHLPTKDRYSPSQSQLLKGALWIRDEVRAERRTLVHCKEGIGRSVAIVCCSLMLGNIAPDKAVHFVRSKRWGVALNDRQMWGLKRFSQRVVANQRPLQPAADRLAGDESPAG